MFTFGGGIDGDAGLYGLLEPRHLSGNSIRAYGQVRENIVPAVHWYVVWR